MRVLLLSLVVGVCAHTCGLTLDVDESLERYLGEKEGFEGVCIDHGFTLVLPSTYSSTATKVCARGRRCSGQERSGQGSPAPVPVQGKGGKKVEGHDGEYMWVYKLSCINLRFGASTASVFLDCF